MGVEQLHNGEAPGKSPPLIFSYPENAVNKAKKGQVAKEITMQGEAVIRESEYRAKVLSGSASRDEVADFLSKRAATFETTAAVSQYNEKAYYLAAGHKGDAKTFSNVYRNYVEEEGLFNKKQVLIATGQMTAEQQALVKNVEIDTHYKKFNALLPDNYLKLKPKEQLDLAQAVVDKNKLGISAEQLRDLVKVGRGTDEVLEATNKLFTDAKFTTAYMKQVKAGKGSEQALVIALKSADAKTRSEYAKNRPEKTSTTLVPTAPAASVAETKAVAKTMVSGGVKLSVKEENKGVVHHGALELPVSFHRVEGRTSLFIEDKNADKGVRGPIDPTADNVKKVLKEVVVGNCFREAYKKYATELGVENPDRVSDSDLAEISEAFLPKPKVEEQTELEPGQRRVMQTIARMLLEKSEGFATLTNKVLYLKEVMKNPEAVAAGKRVLSEIKKENPDATLTLTDFKAEIERRLQV